MIWAQHAAADSLTQEPIVLRPGPYLFLDGRMIAHGSNVSRIINAPVRTLPGPVVTGREDNNFQPYVTVLRQSDTGRYRMWYNVPVDGGQSHLAHLDSLDAIQWIRPHRVLDDPGRIAFGASVLDEGPGFSNPNSRYKFAWYHGGMMLANSSDGLHWTAQSPRPVLTGINDILHLARDTARNRYIAVFGFPSTPEDHYRGKTQNAPAGYRRCVGQSTSTDAVTWTKPRRIFAPDEKDQGITEFYSVGGVLTRGDTLIGLLKVLRDDLPCDEAGKVDGIGYTVLAWSHDGETWHRDREPFFDRNHQPGSWDHAMAWMDYQLPIGDEVFVYYGGYARGHKVERFTERQIGLVRIKRDRYAGWRAEGSGLIKTRSLRIESNQLFLNVDASRGSVRVQILDDSGKPMDGFRFADSSMVTGDQLSASVLWKRSLASLKGRLLQLEVSLQHATLFSIEAR